VFIALVMIQFTKKGNFSRRIGEMVVRGQYLLSDNSGGEAKSGDSFFEGAFNLTGGASVYFGGLEFSLRSREPNEFVLIGQDNKITAALVESVSFADDAVYFFLSGGLELTFSVQAAGDIPEMWITGTFPPDISGVDIPVKLQRKALLREINDEYLSITYDKTAYQFNHPVRIREKAVLSLYEDAASVSYRAIPEQKKFNPSDFIIANARGRQAFNDAISQWADQRFSYWSSNIAQQADEDVVSAFCSEAAKRGTYREAVTSIAPGFVESTQRRFYSSAFIGGMGTAQRSFVQAERDVINNISRLLDEKSPDILIGSHVFEFLFTRGYLNYAEEGLELIHSVDPALITYEMCPGIFEGFVDVRQFRAHGENQFGWLIDQACGILSASLRRDAERDKVFVFRGNIANMEYNIRLGKAIIAWAGAAGGDEWADLGRSLVLSVLAMQDNNGDVPAFVEMSESGRITKLTDNMLSAAAIYKIISSGEYYPRAVVIGSAVNGLWTWTAAAAVSAAQENNILDISVIFPSGETHYMMIRGVRPFAKIQIYNMDYPTDYQFERYDSSGWVYSSQDQILTVKLKHRDPTEHIKIFY
jgi:hypothetical protein